MSLKEKLQAHQVSTTLKKRTEPLWKGPSDAGDMGGITFSSLSRFIQCRERFRLRMIEGLKPTEQFNHKIEYGQMWHICEEALASGQETATGVPYWGIALKAYCIDLAKKYPLQQVEIDKWYNVCKVQFPLYREYWMKHPDVLERTPVVQEGVFKVPYKLQSNRVVYLRGKWDSVDIIGTGTHAGIYLQENKTKGDIDELQIRRQLQFDLQTMIYLTTLIEERQNLKIKWGAGVEVKGVRYNVVRRPLSGGKGSIVQKKGSKNIRPETKEEYYGRLAQYIKDEPETYFMRWKVEISPSDIERFKRECLNPILEQLCDWWEWIEEAMTNERNLYEFPGDQPMCHWRHPFGVYNSLDEGGSTELDEYLNSGSEAGLTRVDELFSELKV